MDWFFRDYNNPKILVWSRTWCELIGSYNEHKSKKLYTLLPNIVCNQGLNLVKCLPVLDFPFETKYKEPDNNIYKPFPLKFGLAESQDKCCHDIRTHLAVS